MSQHPSTLADLADGATYDVVVLGAGAAGLSMALHVAKLGASVLVVESTAHVGGSAAWSGGTVWAPGHALGLRLNPGDSVDAARTYLQAAIGPHSDAAMRDVFLQHADAALQALQRDTHVRLRARRTRPDYMPDLSGAARAGRAFDPLAFDGRVLGPALGLVRPPPPEMAWWGGLMMDRHDLNEWANARRSWRSFRHTAGLLWQLAKDRLSGHARSTRLLRGNALVAMLLQSLRDRGVPILTRTRVTSIVHERGRVQGVVLMQDSLARTVRALGGVALATGGFNRHPIQRAARLGEVDLEWCPGAPGHTGTLHTMAENLGAVYGTGALSPCYWAPVSLRTRRDGTVAAYPHYGIARASPRMVAVDAQGQRFVNEATSPHRFVLAMQEAHVQSSTIPAYLITDADGLRKYGLGMVRPRGVGLKQALADGYVVSAHSLRELADTLEIRAAAFTASVSRFNGYWADGVDSHFHRGATETEQWEGDMAWGGPNPSLGPINKPPFYAVKLYPGDVAAATGLVTNAHAQAMTAQGVPIQGLYAVGNDMQSIMGGVDPAPGSNLGPALVFAYLAAHHAVTQARQSKDESMSALKMS